MIIITELHGSPHIAGISLENVLILANDVICFSLSFIQIYQFKFRFMAIRYQFNRFFKFQLCFFSIPLLGVNFTKIIVTGIRTGKAINLAAKYILRSFEIPGKAQEFAQKIPCRRIGGTLLDCRECRLDGLVQAAGLKQFAGGRGFVFPFPCLRG